MLINDMVQWLQANPMVCPVKKYLHINCPGCGLQRSVAALLQGDVVQSVQYHPVTIPLILFLLYGLLHSIFTFRNGNKITVAGYILVTAVLVSNYIYKIAHHNLT